MTLSVLLLVHRVAPVLSLSTDPLKRLAGGLEPPAPRWLGESRRSVQPLPRSSAGVVLQRHFNEAPINRDFPARSSQFELWDQSTPTSGLFIRPYRSSDYVELEPTGKEITDLAGSINERLDGEARIWQDLSICIKAWFSTKGEQCECDTHTNGTTMTFILFVTFIHSERTCSSQPSSASLVAG